jgi:WD40 repeat protein/DNA-binding SARP family transcriptional activator
MELLWPGMPPDSARTNLRQNLYYLRQTIPDVTASTEKDAIPFLLADRQTVQLNPDYPIDLDLARFGDLLAGPQDKWPEAIELYRGDFLADFYLADTNPFEEWAAARRSAFRRQALEALDEIIGSLIEQGDLNAAEGYARRQLEIDSLRETSYRRLMQILTWSGRQAEALTLYQELLQALEEELDTKPSEATMALAEAIRKGGLVAPASIGELDDLTQIEISGPPPSSPYRGLLAFKEEDARFFFGREAFTERLVKAAADQPFVAIIGPSGGGKSSLLHAGLLAQLRQGENFIIASFRPGDQPFMALSAALLPLLEPEMSETSRLMEIRRLALAFRGGELPLADVVGRLLQAEANVDRLLLLVDHFEELFCCDDGAIRLHFMDELLSVINPSSSRKRPVTLILAIRADFLGQALSHRPFADALQDAGHVLGPMSRDELHKAVEKPAEIQGVAFEAGLVERILDDVGQEPGNLPLLEFALTLLWERQSHRRLTHVAYEQIGRVDGALVQHANQVYESLDSGEQECARRLLVQMVRPGDRADDTRRPARRDELDEASWVMAQKLADARLATMGRDTEGDEQVELVHEALIHSWLKFSAWLDEDRAFRAWQERLRAAMRQWQASDRDDGALLRGAPLAESENWLEEQGERLTPAEREFIQESQLLRDRRTTEREAAQAARERTRQRILVGLVVGLMLALLLLVIAGWQWREANLARTDAENAQIEAEASESKAVQAQVEAEADREVARKAHAKSLASQSELLLDEAHDLALLLGVESANIDLSVESQGSLLTGIMHSPLLSKFLHGHTEDVRSVAISPDGRRLASGDDDGAIIVWNLEEANEDLASEQTTLLTGHSDSITSLAYSPDGQILASGGFDAAVRLWDAETGEELVEPLLEHSDNIWSLAFSPNGSTLASSGADGQILLWDVDLDSSSFGQVLGPGLEGHDGNVASVAFSPDGRLLASGGSDDAIILWDAETFEPIGGPLQGHNSLVRSLTFSPESDLLVSGGNDGTIVLWDTDAGSNAFAQIVGAPLDEHESWITDLAFSPDGDTLASASRDRRIKLWDLATRTDSDRPPQSETLQAHQDAVWSLAFSPDGDTLVSGGADNKLIIWNIDASQPLAEEIGKHAKLINAIDFSPDGRMLASGGDEGTINLWDSVSGEQLVPTLIGDPFFVRSLEFGPQGLIMASIGGTENSAKLWDIDQDSPAFADVIATLLAPIPTPFTSVTFRPDGQVLAAGSRQGHILLWDVAPDSASFGELIGEPIRGHSSSIWDMAFSTNGTKLATVTSEDDDAIWDMMVFPPRPAQLDIPPAYSDAARWRVVTSPTDDLYSSSGQGAIVFWDSDSISPTFAKMIGDPLPASQSTTEGLAFTPDGQILLTGGTDDRIIFWDVLTRRQVGPVLMHPKEDVTRLAISPDGRKMATGSGDGTVFLWDIDVESWKSRACSRANRNLTLEEWSRFFGDEPYRATCPELPTAN